MKGRALLVVDDLLELGDEDCSPGLGSDPSVGGMIAARSGRPVLILLLRGGNLAGTVSETLCEVEPNARGCSGGTIVEDDIS